MKRTHYAWIEEISSFASDLERAAYIDQQSELAECKGQGLPHVVSLGRKGRRFTLRIRYPYDNAKMLIEERRGEDELFGKPEGRDG
jgi:hypothetical protein